MRGAVGGSVGAGAANTTAAAIGTGAGSAIGTGAGSAIGAAGGEAVSGTVATGSGEADVYLLTSDSLDSASIALNGTVLAAAADGTLPPTKAKRLGGAVEIPPASVAFVVDRSRVAACS